MINKALIGLVMASIVGCAGVEYTRINDEQDAKATGLRYYDSSYYLLVYATGRGSIQWHLMELPDQTKLMAARPYAVMAQLDANLDFVHGVLVKSSEKADSTVIPRAIIAAAAEVAAIAAEALLADADPATRELPAPHLYKIVHSAQGLAFEGGPAAKTVFRVTLPIRDGDGGDG